MCTKIIIIVINSSYLYIQRRKITTAEAVTCGFIRMGKSKQKKNHKDKKHGAKRSQNKVKTEVKNADRQGMIFSYWNYNYEFITLFEL